MSTAQAGEGNLAAWGCGMKALHQLSLRVSERHSLGCSYSSATEATPSSQWSLLKWSVSVPIISLRCSHQITSSAELITQIRDWKLVKNLLISALTSPSAVRGWEKENLGANQQPAILSRVLLREPCTASHRHLSKQRVSSRLKLPEIRQVRRAGVIW